MIAFIENCVLFLFSNPINKLLTLPNHKVMRRDFKISLNCPTNLRYNGFTIMPGSWRSCAVCEIPFLVESRHIHWIFFQIIESSYVPLLEHAFIFCFIPVQIYFLSLLSYPSPIPCKIFLYQFLATVPRHYVISNLIF